MRWKTMKKNIPNFIKIHKTSYEVLWTEDFKDGATAGETRFDPNQIVIMKNMPTKETVLTLFHEFIHAVDHENEIGLTENQVLKLEKAMPVFVKLLNELQGKK